MSMNGDRMIQSEAVVSSVRFVSGGRLAGVCADGKVRMWQARSGALTKVVAQDAGDVAPLILDDAEACATIGSDGAVKVRDLRTGAIVQRHAGPRTKVKRLAASRDGKMIAGFGPAAEKANDWTARLWDRTGKQRFAVPCGFGEVWATAISPDGATLAAGSWDTDIRIWNTGKGAPVARIEEVTVSMFAMDFSPDGKVLAAAGADRTVYFLDTRTWKVKHKLTGQNDVIVSIAFSKDGRRLATGGFSALSGRHPAQVVVWDVATGDMIRSVTAPDAAWSVALSEDGAVLANVTGDKTVALWDAKG
jgi:dipeptidyl aminopeptidase/acylaminoacyl peptidase